MDPVTAAIAAGAAAGLTNTASQAVRDAYDALKSALAAHFPRIDIAPLEELPDSAAKQASLAEDLDRSGAREDAEVLRLAWALLATIGSEAPQAASRAGVDLARIRAEFLNVQWVDSLRARDVETSGGITVANVGGRRPN